MESGDSSCGCLGNLVETSNSSILVLDIVNLLILLLVLKTKEEAVYAEAV